MFYVVEVYDPVILGRWGQIEEEVLDQHDKEADAERQLRALNTMARHAGSRAIYYRLTSEPPVPGPQLPEYSPADCEPLDGEGY
jgi:hypothetical protein